jgi:hypothetical protein
MQEIKGAGKDEIEPKIRSCISTCIGKKELIQPRINAFVRKGFILGWRLSIHGTPAQQLLLPLP